MRSSHFLTPEGERITEVLAQTFQILKNANPGAMEGEIKQVRTKLDGFHQERYQGAVVSARAERFLLGKQPTRQALDEEKKYAITKHDGVTSCDKDFIEAVFVGLLFGVIWWRN